MMLCADVHDAHCLQYAEAPAADGRRRQLLAAAAGPTLPKGLDQAFGAGAEQKFKEAILDKKLTQLKAMAARLRAQATTRRARVSRRERRERRDAERAEETG